MHRFLIAAFVCAVCAGGTSPAAEPAKRPNVLFIAIDDMNDWIELLDPQAPIKTPHLKRLAEQGVLFTRAYCASPACNPSRVSVMTGRRPSSTGVYGNKTDWRKALPSAVTLSQHFMQHGYRAEGAGKIYHHHLDGAFHDEASFHDFFLLPKDPMPPKWLNGVTSGSRNFDWGPMPSHAKKAPDIQSVDWALEAMRRQKGRERPLFVAVGIFRPHMPFFAPPSYFEKYPAESLELPVLKPDDVEDIPSGGRALLAKKKWFWEKFEKNRKRDPNFYRDAVQAYQACATFADAQVGRLLDELQEHGLVENTVIVLWSDHGYHLLEKNHWEKFVLWEKATHVPLIVAAPGKSQVGAKCEHPVSLLDLYPTLCELCDLPVRKELEGVSLLPLVKHPQAKWERPALMTYERGNHAVRSRRWRYIRYADGSEELYDHTQDPHEWHNLAGDEQYAKVIAAHARWLPKKNAPPVPDMRRK